MVTPIDSNLLLSYYGAKTNLGASLAGAGAATHKKVAPTAPWSKLPTPEQAAKDASAAVKSALAGHKFVDENAAQLDLPGASADYRKLFALYQGLATLGDLAAEVQKKGLTSIEKQRLAETFTKGLSEVSQYVTAADLDKIRLTMGDVAATAKTTAPVASAKSEYVTAPLYSGTSSDPVPAFQGNVKFQIDVKRSGVDHVIDVDLTQMSDTRSMANVVNFINGKLAAEGVDTRFATQRTPGADRTVTVGGKPVSLGPGPDQWALRVKPGGETVTFSAANTAGAVYLAQGVGDPNPDGKPDTADGKISQQLLKFQTDTATVDAPVQGQNEANWVDGRVFAKTLGPEVKTVRSTKVAADGSVYMLADVTSKTAGQDIRGDQDVALLKYDAAGNLMFSRTLGASDTASGLGLSVSADGKQVAIAGSVVGGLNGAVEGALNSGPDGAFADQTDSFVTVFNADGEEQWTQRRGARQADEASQITFGADGTVYVAGRAKSAMPGGTTIGDWDGYVEGFKPPDATGRIATSFTETFGGTGSDRPAGMVMDGTNLVIASVEDGHAVLRRYDVSGGTPVLSATRDLGGLAGGDIAGLALDGTDVVIAGTTGDGALSAGTVTRNYSGGSDAFAARIASDLSAGGSVAYYGGTGDDKATAMSVAGGKVYIAGTAGTDLPGQAPVGKKDGFVAGLDVAAGTIDYSRRFTGRDGFAAPSAIAVDPNGASALDRLGLPKGTLDLTDSAELVAESSLRPGDTFTVRAGSGRPQTVTIDSGETLDTLAQKIRRATGFQAKVTIGSSEGVRKLTVAPQNNRMVIEFGAGKADKNALELLGIPEGIVRTTVVGKDGVSKPADGKGQIYGLSLASDLNLDSPTDMTHAAAEVAAAQGVIRKIYKDLVAAANPQTAAQQAAAKASSGKVPAYLTNQIANYQAALDRLTGGG